MTMYTISKDALKIITKETMWLFVTAYIVVLYLVRYPINKTLKLKIAIVYIVHVFPLQYVKNNYICGNTWREVAVLRTIYRSLCRETRLLLVIERFLFNK